MLQGRAPLGPRTQFIYNLIWKWKSKAVLGDCLAHRLWVLALPQLCSSEPGQGCQPSQCLLGSLWPLRSKDWFKCGLVRVLLLHRCREASCSHPAEQSSYRDRPNKGHIPTFWLRQHVFSALYLIPASSWPCMCEWHRLSPTEVSLKPCQTRELTWMRMFLNQ